MNRSLKFFAVLTMAAAVVGLPGYTSAAPAAQTQTWTVLVGGESTPQQKAPDQMPAGAWQYMRFYPDKITIQVGDTIVWKLNSAEMHQVVFPAPGQSFVPAAMPVPNPDNPGGPPILQANPQAFFPQGGSTYDGSALTGSGSMSMAGMGPSLPGVQEYRLTFTKAGTFPYLCPFHSNQLPNGQVVGMTGQVTVLDAGSPLPKGPSDVTADASAALAADNQAAQAAEAQVKQVAPPSPGPNGTLVYHGNIGWDAGNMAYMRFAPEDFTVHVGDTIEWTQTSAQAPHTVSFFSGAKEPDLITIQPQPSGPPKLLFNLQAVVPLGGATYNGSGIVSSGNMPGTQNPQPGPRTYRLTFTRPGTFEFICIFHDQMGMSGHVTVLAAESVAPGMPTTGNPGNTLWLLALVVAANLAFAGFVLRSRPTGDPR